MKLLKPSSLLFTVIVACSCNLIPPKPGIWKNETINAGKRKTLHTFTDSLFSYLKDANTDNLESILSQEMLDNNYNKRVYQLIGNHLKTDNYTLLADYYAINRLRHLHFIKPNTDSLNMTYRPAAKEMYIAFYVPKKMANKQMITVVCAKLDYGWKVVKLELEPYTHNGKTAAQLFVDARKLYAKGYLVDAVNTMSLASNCSRPSEEILYGSEYDTKKFYDELIYEANLKYKYPLIINGVATNPAIFNIGTQSHDDGTYPAIYYTSKINVKDTVAIKEENKQVKKMIGQVMPGIDKDKKYILYYVYNKTPNGKVNTQSFSIIDKLE